MNLLAKKYRFGLNEIPLNFQWASLFNSQSFLQRHNNKVLQFQIKEDSQAVAIINFTIINDVAHSPWRASFGGIEFYHPVPEEEILLFTIFFIKKLYEVGIKEIRIGCSPDYYDPPNIYKFCRSLKEIGFIPTVATGQLINVTNESFEARIKRFEKNRIIKAEGENLYAELGVGSFPREVYDLIYRNRQRRNIPVTIDFEELEKNFVNFSNYFLWFIVRNRDLVVAGSIGIRVRKDVLYYFFPGHDQNYHHLSPLVLNIAEKYRYCQANNIQHLDLGLSSEAGKINDGLYRFKSNLGAIEYKQVEFKSLGK